MSTAKCEKKLKGPQTPTGICCHFRTTTGSMVDCQVTRTGSEFCLDFENHNSYAVGLRVKCESVQDEVEFECGNLYQDSIVKPVFLKPRKGHKPCSKSITIDIQPQQQSNTNDEIRVEAKAHKIKSGTNPDLDETIDVDVN